MAYDRSTIDKAFVRKLKSFAEKGYKFDSKGPLPKGEKPKALRKGKQRDAFNAYAHDFAENHRHGYFEIPTGVGKTALFISLLKNYIDAANGHEDAPRALIVVPTEKLAVQTAQAFRKFMPEIAPTIETDDDKGREMA